MVAIVSGNGAGILNTSAGTLGQGGVFGNAANGNSKDSVYINIANGNLLLQDQDDCIVARGVDSEIVRTYNSQGQLNTGDGVGWRQATRRQLTGLTGTVNTAGSTITRIVGDGSATVFTYDVARAAYFTTEGGGAYQTITFSAANNQWTWQADHNDLYGEHEVYNGTTGLIYSATDYRYGAIFYFTHDSSNRLTKLTNAHGDTTYFDYVNGNVSKVRTVMAGVTGDFSRVSYQYDALNRLTGVITDLTPENKADAKTYTVNYTYLSNTSQVETVTQSDGTRLNFTYVLHDGKNKVASVTDALGRSTSFDYTQPGKTIVTDSLGFKTAYAYDANGQLLSVTAPAVAGVSQITQFEYDAAGNISRTVDARGLATTYGYDGNGNRILERDSTGATITRTFSSANKVLSETRYIDLDPDGAGGLLPTQKLTTRYVYDTYNVVRFIISPEGRVREYRYNAQHQLLVDLAYIGIKFAENSAESAYAYNAMVTWSQSTAVKAAAATRVDYAYDGRGLVMQSTSYAATAGASNAAPAIGPDTAIVQYVYDHAGQLLQSIDGNGNTTTYAYDGLGRQLSATDPQQNVVLHTYDDAGNRIVTRRADGVTSTSTYDKSGQLLATVLAEANGTVVGTSSYLYDNAGKLRTVIDPNGGRSHILYDEAGRKAATVTAAGSLTEYRYDANNQLALTIAYATSVSQASLAALIGTDGKPVTATLETAGLRPAATAADQREWRLYDNANRLLKTVDALGYVTDYSYDGASRLLDTIRRATVIDLTAFAANPNVANASPAPHANDRVARNSYDKDGKLRFTMDGEGYLSEFQYDLAGRHTGTVRYAAAVDPAARSGSGWMTAAASSVGITASTTYDGRGQVVSQTDGAGNTTTFTYDGQGNVLTSTTAGVATCFVYDKLNRLIESHADANASNVTSKVAYDAQGNKVAVTDAMGNTTRLVYDASNRQVFSIDPLGIVTETRYNANGNAVATIRYSKAINVVSAEQVLGASDVRAVLSADIESVVHQRYDRDGRLTWTVDATGAATQLVYDAKGNVVRRIAYKNALGTDELASLAANPGAVPVPANEFTATSYIYDENDRLVFTIDAMGAVAESRYDAQGNVIETVRYATPIDTSNTQTPAVLAVRALLRVDAAKDVHEFRRYDKEGHLTWSVDAAGAATQFIYDANGNVVKRLAYTDPLTAAALASLAADACALPAPAGASSMTQFAYDGDNRLVFTVDPLGIVSENRYDVRGNVVETVRYAVPITLANDAQLTVASIKPLLLADAKDVHQFQRYDALGRLAWSVDGTGAATQLFYDNSGNLIKRLAFTERLTPAAMASLAGNASELPAPTGASAMTQYAYDADNRLVFTVDALGIVTENRYDVNGKAVETVRYATPVAVGDSTQQLSAAAIKALVQADAAKDVHQFQRYDKDGRLAWSVDGTGAVTQLIYDTQGNLVKRLAYAGGLTASALASLSADASAIPAITGASTMTQYVYDADNRLVFTIDAMGAVAESRYDALGNLVETVHYATPIALTAVSATDGKTLSLAGGSFPAIVGAAAAVDTTKTYKVRARVRQTSGEAEVTVGVRTTDANGKILQNIAPGATSSYPGGYYSYPAGKAIRLKPEMGWQVFEGTISGEFIPGPDAYDAHKFIAGSKYAAPLFLYNYYGTPAADGSMGVEVDYLEFIDAAGNVLNANSSMAEGTSNWTNYSGSSEAINTPALTLSSVRALLRADASKDIHQFQRFDKESRLTWSVDAAGAVSRLFYDAKGNVVSRVAYTAALSTAAMAKLAADPSSMPMPGNGEAVTNYVYDDDNRLVFTIDPLGAVSENRYDASGNVIETVRYAKAVDPRLNKSLDGKTVTQWGLNGAHSGTTVAIDTNKTYAVRARVRQVTGSGSFYLGVVALDANKNWLTQVNAPGNPYPGANGVLLTPEMGWQEFEGTITGEQLISPNSYDPHKFFQGTKFAQPLVFTNISGQVGADGNAGVEVDYIELIDVATGQVLNENSQMDTGAAAWSIKNDTFNTLSVAKVRQMLQADAVKDIHQRNRYDSNGRLTWSIDALGGVTERRYDANGNLSRTIVYASGLAGALADGAVPQVIATAPGSGGYVLSNALDRVTDYVYDAKGRLVSQTDAVGTAVATTQSWAYDGAGNAIRHTDGCGNTSWSAYDASNRLVRHIDAAGYVTTRSYFADGRLKAETRYANAVALPQGANDAWAYDAATNPVANTNPVTGDQTTSWTYDSAGRMQTSTDAANVVTFYAYDGLGNLTDTTVAYGTAAASTVHRNYDRASRLSTETRAYGTVDAFTTQYGYDTWGNQTTITAGGLTTTQYFDALGRKTGVKDANQALTTTAYNAFGDIVKVTDARNNSGYFFTDLLGRVTMQVDPEGAVSETRYDLQGNVASVIRYANKVQGPVNENARPQVLSMAGSGVFVVQSPSDQYQENFFDALGRTKETRTWYDGSSYYTESFEYDGNGNKKVMTSRNGAVTTYEYDKNNRLIVETLPVTSKDAANASVAVQNRLEYDARGNVVKKIEAYGLPEQRVTTYVFDKLNRQVKEIGEPITTFDPATRQDQVVAPTKEQKYDLRGNLIEEADARGGRTLHFYDNANRETGRIDSLGTYTRFTYDIAGQKASQTIYANAVQVAGGSSISNTSAPVLLAPGSAVPASGAYLQLDAANDRTANFTYDGVGRLKTTFNDGITTGIFSKATNRYVVGSGTVRTQVFYDAAGNVTKTIDANGNVARSYYNKAGQLTATLDAMRYLTLYERDAFGNVKTQTSYANSLAANVLVDDSTTQSLLTVVASADDRVTAMTYDRMGRTRTESRLNLSYASVDATTGAVGETTGAATSTYEYDGLSNVTKRIDANGAVTEWKYDSLGRKTEELQAAFVDYRGVTVRTTTDLEYDGLNQVRREIVRGEDSTVETDDRITRYFYGVGGYLISQTDAGNARIDYRLDAAGNITRKTLVGRVNADGVRADDVTYYWYDAQGREVRHADGATNTTVETRYNAFGEITGKRTNPVAGSTEWAEFTDYDQTGRAWRSNSGDGITHIYLHDANGNGTLKLDHATTDLRNYALLSALNIADSNQFYSVYDARNQLSDTYQPPMNGQHNLITVEESLTQKQGTSFAGVGSFISMGVASGLTSADSAVMPSATGAVTVVRALSAALTLTDQYSVSSKYYGGGTMRGASHTLTVSLPDTSYLGPGPVRVDFSVPESGSLGGYEGSFYPTAGAPSVTFNEPVDWEFDQMPGGRDFSITLYKESANGLVVLGTRVLSRPAPWSGSSTVNTTITTSGNALKFTGQRSDTQRLILMTRPSGSTAGWTITEVPKAVVNGGVEAGSFSFDWTGWPRNSYEFRYVCFNGSNDVVNSQQGTMVLNDSNPSISQVSHTMGGPGRAFFDANGSIVFNELGGQAATLTVSYRPQGGNWTSVQLWPSNVGGTSLPGWFTLPAGGFGVGNYEYTIEAKNASNVTINKSSSSFTIGSPSTISDPSGVSVQTTPAASVAVVATSSPSLEASLYRKNGWHTVYYNRYDTEGHDVPDEPYNSLYVPLPDTSSLGTGNIRIEFKVEPSYGDGSFSGGFASTTVAYNQGSAHLSIWETVSGWGGNFSTYYSYRVVKETPYGDVQIGAYGGWSKDEYHDDVGTYTNSTVQYNLNWVTFSVQPAVQGAQLLLEFRRQGDPGPWDLVTIPPQVINGQTVPGRFATDWTTWPAGAYDYRTLVIDAVGNTLQTGSGTMNLGHPVSVSPPTQDLIGGAGRVYMDRAGNLVFTEQSTATETLTIRYRKKGTDELWSTRADLPRTSVPGWFVFTPPADAPSDLEYVLEARRGGQLLNKVAGTFTKLNANSVSALQGYTEPPAVTHFKSQPASAAAMRLSYRPSGSGAYTTVNLTKVATGVFDWASGGIFGSDTENRNYDYIYETLDSNGVLVNKAHGLMTLGRDPRVVSHVSDSTPTMASFNVPSGNPVAATATTMVLQYRLLGSNGPFLTVDLPKGANNAFVWDASSIVPPGTSGAVDYSYTLKNGSTVLKRDDGADIRVDGTLYLGPTDGDAQLKWLQSGTVNNVALIHHAQKTNAFGEVVSETNARDFTTVSVYNVLGKLVRKEDPNVNVTLSNGYQYGMTPRTYYYYDRAGRMLASRDANGNLTSQILLAGSGAVATELHADGGRKESGYDLFGDLRYGKDEIGLRTDYSYDKNGRLTLIQRPVRTDATRAEVYMTYDEAGNRITHAATPDASSSLASYTSKTYYDSLGRVSKVLTPAGRGSNYTYVWDAAIKSTGGRVVGGWRQTVSDPMGRTVIDEIDAYGRTTVHTDLGGHKFYYNFNFAGWLSSQTGSTGQNISYTYYANGYVKSIRDNALQTESSYEYDAAGNRVYEAYQRTVNGQVEYLENSTIDYDASNRVVRIRDPRADIQYEYDAVGNRRRVHSMYHDGVNGSVQIQDYWYDYDNMNRFILTMGKLSSANGARGTSATDTSVRVVLGGGEGVEVHYNKASQRVMTVAARDGHREDYTYGVEGYLEFTYINANASARGSLASMRVNDRLGRTVAYTEYSGGNISYQRSTVYTADGRQKSQTGTDGTTTYYYYNSRQANGYDSVTDLSSDGVGELAKVQTVKAGAATVTNVTSYDYWDDAKQRSQTVAGEAPYKTDTQWRPGVSWFEYDINGHLVKSVDAGVDGKMDTADDVSFRFITNGQGLILRREQFKGNTVGMMHRYMYLNGVMVGDVGNDGDSHLDYAQTLATQNQSREQMYKNWRPVSSADFDQNYQPINRSYPAATGSSYTVKAGDSLYAIAGAVWGDVSMWYLIADANGLSAETELQAGQTLTIPNKVTNIHNNSGTFRPYEPGTIIGDTSPTLPDAPMPAPPPRKHGCGGIAQIVMIVVAVVATVITAGAAAAALGTTLAQMGLTQALIVGAVSGAAGSLASQAAGVAMGVQSSISWKGVAMGALSGAVTLGVGAEFNAAGSSGLLSGTNWSAVAGRAVLANVTTQAAANVVGLQKGFNWSSVAVSAISAPITSQISEKIGKSDWASTNQHLGILATSTASAVVSVATRVAVVGGRVSWEAVAIDAVGNALGSSLAQQLRTPSAAEERLWAGVDKDKFDRDVRDQIQNGERFVNLDPVGSAQQNSSSVTISGTPWTDSGRTLADGTLINKSIYSGDNRLLVLTSPNQIPLIEGYSVQSIERLTSDEASFIYRAENGNPEVSALRSAEMARIVGELHGISPTNIVGESRHEVQVGAIDEPEPVKAGIPVLQTAGDYALRFFDWTRSSALNSVAMTYDSNQRGGYMQAIKANARAAVQQIDALGPTRIPEVASVARSASAFRDAARTATQKTLTPWGEFMSKRIEGNANVPFEDRMAHREAKLTKQLGRAPAEFELLKGVAAGAGYSNKWVSRFASGARILGPVMTVGQIGMIGSQVYQAAPDERLHVAGREGFKLSSNLLYGALGSVAGVAGAGLLLASPFGAALGAYAGITYLAASFGGGIAGGMFGGVVADRILGPN